MARVRRSLGGKRGCGHTRRLLVHHLAVQTVDRRRRRRDYDRVRDQVFSRCCPVRREPRNCPRRVGLARDARRFRRRSLSDHNRRPGECGDRGIINPVYADPDLCGDAHRPRADRSRVHGNLGHQGQHPDRRANAGAGCIGISEKLFLRGGAAFRPHGAIGQRVERRQGDVPSRSLGVATGERRLGNRDRCGKRCLRRHHRFIDRVGRCLYAGCYPGNAVPRLHAPVFGRRSSQDRPFSACSFRRVCF